VLDRYGKEERGKKKGGRTVRRKKKKKGTPRPTRFCKGDNLVLGKKKQHDGEGRRVSMHNVRGPACGNGEKRKKTREEAKSEMKEGKSHGSTTVIGTNEMLSSSWPAGCVAQRN